MGAVPLGDEAILHKPSTSGDDQSIRLKRSNKVLSANVSDGIIKCVFEACAAQDTAEVWNVHISDKVMNPSTRRQLGRGHGKM